MKSRTCVSPSGHFVYGLHEPHFRSTNLRPREMVESLGATQDGKLVDNRRNFPPNEREKLAGDPVFEIPNAFPFRGTTYINRRWADARAQNPQGIRLKNKPSYSFTDILAQSFDRSDKEKFKEFFASLPDPVCLALATTSTDPRDLTQLAQLSCKFVHNGDQQTPTGIVFRQKDSGQLTPDVLRPELFEAVANNPHLPDSYKEVMVLRPGIQGNSPIVGECGEPKTNHVWEYLRSNSYIPWGHYAANMAHDTIRYQISDLTFKDIRAMRHLYVQRTYTRLAQALGITWSQVEFSSEGLENLRRSILERMADGVIPDLEHRASLWGWNYGFDYAPSSYRLHASHQQIHQQYALIPSSMTTLGESGATLTPFSFGDLVSDFVDLYKKETGQNFFSCYLDAIGNNTRMDERPNAPKSLVVHEDTHVVLFVPKAQTSQWELQLMVKDNVGNILETDLETQHALNQGIFTAIRTLGAMGIRMVSTIEISSKFDKLDAHQHLIYAFLPRLPESPGAFSEAQLRWINGHYPEDFALACRTAMTHSDTTPINPEAAE